MNSTKLHNNLIFVFGIVTLVVFTIVFTFSSFGATIDITSDVEYFIPNVIEFLDYNGEGDDVSLALLTSASSHNVGNRVLGTNVGGSPQISIGGNSEYTTSYSTYDLQFSFSNIFSSDIVLHFPEFYHYSSFNGVTDSVEVRFWRNDITNFSGYYTLDWTEQYYDSEDNYIKKIVNHNEVYYHTNGIIAFNPMQWFEHTDPMEHSTITDFTITVHSDNVQFTNAYIMSDSNEYIGVAYGVDTPPQIVQEVVTPDVLQWLVTSVNSFMSAEIFGPNITIGAIIGIAVAVPLVIWFLKLLAGG